MASADGQYQIGISSPYIADALSMTVIAQTIQKKMGMKSSMTPRPV